MATQRREARPHSLIHQSHFYVFATSLLLATALPVRSSTPSPASAQLDPIVLRTYVRAESVAFASKYAPQVIAYLPFAVAEAANSTSRIHVEEPLTPIVASGWGVEVTLRASIGSWNEIDSFCGKGKCGLAASSVNGIIKRRWGGHLGLDIEWSVEDVKCLPIQDSAPIQPCPSPKSPPAPVKEKWWPRYGTATMISVCFGIPMAAIIICICCRCKRGFRRCWRGCTGRARRDRERQHRYVLGNMMRAQEAREAALRPGDDPFWYSYAIPNFDLDNFHTLAPGPPPASPAEIVKVDPEDVAPTMNLLPALPAMIHKDSGEELEIPHEYLCVITGEMMRDPVVTMDGHTYERSAITKWLEEHDTSPKTGAQLASKMMVPNLTLRSQMLNWMDKLNDNYIEKQSGYQRLAPSGFVETL